MGTLWKLNKIRCTFYDGMKLLMLLMMLPSLLKKAGLLALALKKNAEAKNIFYYRRKYQDYDGGTSDAYIRMVKLLK